MKTLPFPLVALRTIIQGTSLSFLENTIDKISVPRVFHSIYSGPLLSPLFSPSSLDLAVCIPAPGGGGGVLPYISHICMCHPKEWGFSAVLV